MFWLKKTKELLEKEDCTSWLPNLEIDQVIDEEYLQTKSGTERSTEVREWWSSSESINAMLIAGSNLLKSGDDDLMQWANESEDASMRHDLVQII